MVKHEYYARLLFLKIDGHDVLSRVNLYDAYTVRLVLHRWNSSIKVSSLLLCLPNLPLPIVSSNLPHDSLIVTKQCAQIIMIGRDTLQENAFEK